MKPIHKALNGIDGYLISVERDVEIGNYTLQVGLPKKWAFDGNDKIECEVLEESSVGKVVRIAPLDDDIVIDDLINFVSVIVKTNNRIAEKEKEFSDKMDEMKNSLENEAKKFYEELEELKENSFRKINDKFLNDLDDDDKPKRGRGRPRKIVAVENESKNSDVNDEEDK
jgi:hypothetical protein